MLTFLIGGARSGKSALALELATAHVGGVVYVATSPRIEGDVDLDNRIDAHRAERPAAWTTIEEPLDLVGRARARRRLVRDRRLPHALGQQPPVAR